jgi:hypothetical protein
MGPLASGPRAQQVLPALALPVPVLPVSSPPA